MYGRSLLELPPYIQIADVYIICAICCKFVLRQFKLVNRYFSDCSSFKWLWLSCFWTRLVDFKNKKKKKGKTCMVLYKKCLSEKVWYTSTINIDLQFCCLSLQSFVSGIGNWIADEVLYQVSLSTPFCVLFFYWNIVICVSLIYLIRLVGSTLISQQ